MYINGKNISFTERSNPSVDMFLRNIDNTKPLTTAEEYELWQQMQQGSKQARERLILHNRRYVVTVAKKYLLSGAPFEDLLLAGMLGLIVAIDKFDARRGVRLISFATWYIKNEVHNTAYLYCHPQKVTTSIDETAYADNDNSGSMADLLHAYKDSASDWQLYYDDTLNSIRIRLDKQLWLGAGEMFCDYLSMTEKGYSVNDFARKYRLSEFQLRNYLKAVRKESLDILQAA